MLSSSHRERHYPDSRQQLPWDHGIRPLVLLLSLLILHPVGTDFALHGLLQGLQGLLLLLWVTRLASSLSSCENKQYCVGLPLPILATNCALPMYSCSW